ncbi:hypothetical protein LUZ61_005012 [Rhynchospora tenuis]|uniref:Serine/threonine protein phosphatase 2A regulatory subunit n=1 Tax=Rhynchospora tenuis TaxID=198213 RepID=A0AAD6EU47_9POAL|nr:hypothetical protein LUZ61_005012 [Rhynchospora tenuis]
MWKHILVKLAWKSSKSNSGGSNSSTNNNATSLDKPDKPKAISPSSVLPTELESTSNYSHVMEKHETFLKKLDLCCITCDFSDRAKDYSEDKESKRQALIELVEFLTSCNEQLSEPMIIALCRMFSINLFRVFPPKIRSKPGPTGGADIEEDDPVFDPSWYHIQIVYDLLLKFITSSLVDVKIARKYMDNSFVSKLLDLFDSEDPRERDCLKTILHRIYGKFMSHRPFIRKEVSNIFYRFVFETDRHNGIAELLEVFGSVISGFAKPLKEEHKVFLWKALVPLHKPKTVGTYLPQLTYCVMQFIEKEPKLASTVIRGLLKYWPVTNSQKEMMFLGELEEVLEATDMAEFHKCMVPLFRRLAQCLNSSHFQVAERALFLSNNDHLVNMISQNRQVILPLIYPALERNARWHWNRSVLNVTMNVRKMFFEMDENLLLACESSFVEEEEKKAATEERRRLIWERLENFTANGTGSGSAFSPAIGSELGFGVPPPVVAAAPLVA